MACIPATVVHNLLKFMGKRSALFAAVFAASHALVSAQSQAAVEKLGALFTAEQLADMQEHTHYKYVGLLLYHSSSFLVSDKAGLRAATEDEVASVDLLQYAEARRVNERVTVHDATTGKDLVLLGRDEFEALMFDRLNETDRAAYLAYKAAAQNTPATKTP